jgi:putative ABC transport system permease protein
MLKNYVIVAFRNIRKKLGFSVINISGLAIAMASFILIALWVLDEFSYNSFNKNSDRIFGVVNDQYFNDEKWYVSSTPALLAPALKEEFPEVVRATRYQNAGEVLISFNNNSFFEKGMRYVDPDFFEIFTFPLVSGDKGTILSDPNNMVISQEFAKKYFGDESPIGKSLLINNEDLFTVSGVFKNSPNNSTIKPEMLVSYEYGLARDIKRGYNPHWRSNSPNTFILLNSKYEGAEVNRKVKDFVRIKSQDNDAPEFSLVPLEDVRFSPYYGGRDRMKQIIVFSSIAILILVVACMNFLSLSSANTIGRAKEIGIRKVVGATRWRITNQFLVEYFTICFLALIIAFSLAVLFLPQFNLLFNKTLHISAFFRSSTVAVLMTIAFFTGLVGGGYPAFQIASIKTVAIFTGYLTKKGKTVSLRRVFVVFQFILSVTLIVLMIVIGKQLDFMKSKNQGMDIENVVIIEFKAGAEKNYYVLKENFNSIPGIKNVTGSGHPPMRIWSETWSINWNGKDPDDRTLVHFTNIDYDFCNALSIELVEGKEFSKDLPPAERDGVIVNQEMLKLMGIEAGVGEKITWGGDIELRIIGVVKNFHFIPMKREIPPLALPSLHAAHNRLTPRFLILRIDPNNLYSTIEHIKKNWNEINPGVPFEYRFLEDDLEANYKGERTEANVITSFTLVAIVISLLGLFGLAFFSSEQRKKEIAIRKVIGSTAGQIASLLFKEYLVMVLIACAVAWPVGYHFASKWLQGFAYKVDIDVWVFVISGIAALVIALLAVFYQSVKASVANPIDSIARE